METKDTDNEVIPEVIPGVSPLPTPEVAAILAYLDGDAPAPEPEEPAYAPVKIREARPEDYNFILKAWLTGARDYAWVNPVPDGFYFSAHRDYIAAVASRPNAVCLVAVDTEDDNNLFGFIVAEKAHLARTPDGRPVRVPIMFHYVYVKRTFRRMDIARRLAQSVGWVRGDRIYGSHHSYVLTKDGGKLAKRYFFVYNPYAFFDPQWYRLLDERKGA